MAAIFISTVLNKLLWDTQGGKSIKGVGENSFLNFPRLRLIATRKTAAKIIISFLERDNLKWPPYR